MANAPQQSEQKVSTHDAYNAHNAPPPLAVWFAQEARDWGEAFPIGNGRLGAMAFGGVREERLALNEDTLWSGRPYSPVQNEARGALETVREWLADGRIADAQHLASQTLLGRPACQQAYVPAGDLLLSVPHHEPITEYRRELDLQTATVRVSYVCDGARWTRTYFISHPDQVLAARLECDQPGRVHVQARLATPHPDHCMEAEAATGTLVLRGAYTNGGTGKTPAWTEDMDGPGLRFTIAARVEAQNGQITTDGNVLVVANADSVVFRLAIATSWVRYDDVSGDPDARCEAALASAAPKPWEALLADHVADHAGLFRRVSLSLTGDANGADALEALPTDERLGLVRAGGDDAGLCALYFQFARYLLIACSRPGTQAANLQGIWNADMVPAWGSKWTTNMNAQMNYWLAESGNLADCHEPLFDLIDDLSVTGAEVARAHYDADGWTVHHNTDLWRAAAPADGVWGVWPTGAAWLCRHLWEHYEYGEDTKFLRERAYPVMKSAAAFLQGFLVRDPNGFLVITPSVSPENTYLLNGESFHLSSGVTMDNAIVRDHLRNCVAAAHALGIDHELRRVWSDTVAALPPYQIGKHGQIQEWRGDYEETNPGHRHIAHLYGLHPASDISPRGTPETAQAARRTLDRRLAHGGGHTGWSAAWIINFWARLGDGAEAHAMLLTLLRHSTLPNLFDDHPPFQIDGNFGGAAGIVETLLQSHENEIALLPALPPAWPSGAFTGLRARGGVSVDLKWRNGRAVSVSLTAQTNRTVRLRPAPDAPVQEITFDAGQTRRIVF